MQNTDDFGRWHRARAVTLGMVAELVALLAAYTTCGAMLGELHRLQRRSALRTADALPVLLWAALVLALLWAAVLIGLATAALLRGSIGGDDAGRGHARGPGPLPTGVVGRVTALLLAVTALSGLSSAAPALAATAAPTAPSSATATSTSTPPHRNVLGPGEGSRATANTDDSCDSEEAPTPGWVPEKPTRTEQRARECAHLVTGRSVADDSGEVVVRRGDTLWSLAAAHLGPHADARAIAAEWPRWYAANREVIGDDPDTLSIGTRLHTPDPALEGSTR